VHKRLLPLTMLATLLPAFLLREAPAYPVMVILVLIFAACFASIVPLTDNAVLTFLGSRRDEYGRVRVWGAVGFGLAGFVTGALIERTGSQNLFLVYIACMGLAALAATQLPAPGRLAVEPYWHSLRRLLTDVRWLGFLASVLLFGIAISTINNYFVLYLTHVGASESLFGLAVLIATISELPVFVLSPIILRRYSPTVLMLLAFATLSIRCFLYSRISDPYHAVAVQLLHGPSFSAMWAGGVNYASRLAPEGLGASAQSLFVATSFGLSGVGGALIGSQLFISVGPAGVFLYASLFAAAGLILFTWVTFGYGRPRTA
jgi:hypothetical protein